jgi:hypothetical protein
MNVRQSPARRRGAVAVLTAILLVVFLGFVALAVDIGFIVVGHAELQNAADAAALAGASQLLDHELLKGSTHQSTAIDSAMTNGRAQAKGFAQQNPCIGKALQLDDNTPNTLTGDICFGLLSNPADRSQTLVPTVPGVGPYPNSVQVIAHRDATRNGSLALFFARIFGITSQGLDAKATATYEGRINGFKIQWPGTTTCKLLPYTLDVNVWNQLVAGTGSDNFTRSSSGAVSSGSDGIPECKLFPLSNGNGSGDGDLPPGNFGTVDIGASNNSTSDIARQILYGPNVSDLSYFPGGALQLDPVTHTVILQGDTGVSAGVKDELASIIGQPRIIPLYSSVTGNGNNAHYTIVAFVGVTILEVDLTGSLSSKHITIQPCYVIEPNALGGGTESTSQYMVKPLGLTR